jgi:hypothetical protein
VILYQVSGVLGTVYAFDSQSLVMPMIAACIMCSLCGTQLMSPIKGLHGSATLVSRNKIRLFNKGHCTILSCFGCLLRSSYTHELLRRPWRPIFVSKSVYVGVARTDVWNQTCPRESKTPACMLGVAAHSNRIVKLLKTKNLHVVFFFVCMYGYKLTIEICVMKLAW